MANTYRRNKRTRKRERDGYNPAISRSCEHNGGCPYCERNRLYNRNKTESEALDRMSWAEDEFLNEYDFTCFDAMDYYYDTWEYLERWKRDYLMELDMDLELPETDWENYKRGIYGRD